MSDDHAQNPSEQPPADKPRSDAPEAAVDGAPDGAEVSAPALGPVSSPPPAGGGMKRKSTLQPRNSSVPPPHNAPDGEDDPAATPVIVPHPMTGAVSMARITAPDRDLDAITADYDLDDAPTADYDPRARGVFERPAITATAPTQSSDHPPGASTSSPPDSQVGSALDDGPPPIPPSVPPSVNPSAPPPADAVLATAQVTLTEEQEGDEHAILEGPTSSRRRGKRRSSRRTVKIPDDPIVRAKPVATVEADAAMVAKADDAPSPTSEPDVAAATDSQDGTAAAPLASLSDDADSEAVTIIRPMQIVDIQGASKPPPDLRAAAAQTAPTSPGPPPPTGKLVPVSVSAKPPPPSGKVSPKPPPVEEHEEEVDDEIIISTTALTEEDLDAIEEIEPDRMSLGPPEPEPTPRKPPPPPPSNQRAVKQREREQESAPAAREPTPTQPPAAERKRQKPWWEDLFGDDYLRTMDRLEAKHISHEVDFVEDSLGVEKGAVILDLACGSGQHAVELASRGYNVVGYDLSLAMLARAADEAQDRQQKLNFLQGDMREMAFEEMFDGVYCWSTSFGYFDDERNLSVLQRIHRALRQGGMLLLDVVNRDYVAPRSPSLVWFEGDGCVCMDDMHVDFFTSRLRVKRTVMFDDGRSRELDYSIRLYALHELGKMLHDSGFKVVEVTGHPTHLGVFFGSESPRMIVLAERS